MTTRHGTVLVKKNHSYIVKLKECAQLHVNMNSKLAQQNIPYFTQKNTQQVVNIRLVDRTYKIIVDILIITTQSLFSGS